MCIAGTYSSPRYGNCSLCPANSFSDRDGVTECTCNPGYFRAPGEEDLPCRSKINSFTYLYFQPLNDMQKERPDDALQFSWRLKYIILPPHLYYALSQEYLLLVILILLLSWTLRTNDVSIVIHGFGILLLPAISCLYRSTLNLLSSLH